MSYVEEKLSEEDALKINVISMAKYGRVKPENWTIDRSTGNYLLHMFRGRPDYYDHQDSYAFCWNGHLIIPVETWRGERVQPELIYDWGYFRKIQFPENFSGNKQDFHLSFTQALQASVHFSGYVPKLTFHEKFRSDLYPGAHYFA